MSPQTFSPNSFQTFVGLFKYLRRREHLTQLKLSIVARYSEAQIGRLEENRGRLVRLDGLFHAQVQGVGSHGMNGFIERFTKKTWSGQRPGHVFEE